MHISVIIPAHNAVETITDTLDSLLAQTFPEWEAIVVDDGSSDDTTALVARFAQQDARIRLVQQSQRGVSAARNTGISFARYDWLLFLDADDWLAPVHLARLTDLLLSTPDLDAACCNYTRVAPDGTRFDDGFRAQSGDLFVAFARACIMAIHACIIRRSLVEAVGGFDPLLRTCEDWDLWQRIARTGARFGVLHEVYAFYRMRPASASVDGQQFLADSLRVLALGHAPDPRVSNPHPAHASGQPAEQLSGLKFYPLCWAAGLMLGHGEDARSLLDVLKEHRDPGLAPHGVAEAIFRAALLPTCRTPAAWVDLWPSVEGPIVVFLEALEAQSTASGLAPRTRTILERLILEHATALRPCTVGATHAVQVEVSEPIPDIRPPARTERLQCTINLAGTRLGTLTLPVCDGLVSHLVLADAIAAEFAWPLLGQFFERTVYRDLRVEREPTGMSLWRGALRLADALPEDTTRFWSQAHDQAGWLVFLQELWACPDWPNARFYDPHAAAEGTSQRRVEDGWLVVEVSTDLPDVEVSGPELNIVFTVGGVALGIVTVPVTDNIVRAQELRVALTMASGFELCRAVVREGFLGRPFTGPASLHARLAAAAAQHDGNGPPLEAVAHLELTLEGVACGGATVPALAPGSARALHRALPPGERGIVLSRRAPTTMGTSVSRRVMLPAAAGCALVEAASIAGEPVLQVPRFGEQPELVVYAPDLLWRPCRSPRVPAREARTGATHTAQASVYGRHHFESIFATQRDPWKYTNSYEQTLALLPPVRIARALELACAEGHFTVQLAPRVDRLIAADISQIALNRAADRCARFTHIHFMHLDLTKDPLPGRCDLIVCSEVLYYVGGHESLQAVARKFVDALNPGGYLLTAHAHLIIDEPDRPGFDWGLPFGAKVIGEILASTRHLQLVQELRTPLYRIQLFQRPSRVPLCKARSTPKVIELAQQPAPLPPEVASQVLWHGGASMCPAQTVVTDRLPILMYHRVALTGSSAAARYRVSPEAFEEQLRYLHEAGFYSTRLEDWQAAMATRQPLPGRALLITFDDGYLDFLTHAWPLLQSYGFLATVFLVADAVGRSNHWDHGYGEEIPLLGWKEIRQLQKEGVEFGSHAASHRPLTALSLEDIVREGARSRVILERELRVPISAFAYPYGDTDQVVQHLIGACGYVFGLSCQPSLSRFSDSLLALPRIEVSGSEGLREFVSNLE